MRARCLIYALLLLAGAFRWLVSCGTAEPPAAAGEVLAAMLAAAPDAPAGMVRDSGASPDSAEYLTPELLSALFGSACRSEGSGEGTESGQDPLIDEAAVFLPAALHPGELAVFRCSSQDDCVSAAALCGSRLNLLRAAWSGSGNTIFTDLLGRALVRIEGPYVLLIISEDPDALLSAARGAIRGGTGTRGKTS